MILVLNPIYKIIVFNDHSARVWSYWKIAGKKFTWEGETNARITLVISTYEKRKQEEKKQKKEIFLKLDKIKLSTKSFLHRANNQKSNLGKKSFEREQMRGKK